MSFDITLQSIMIGSLEIRFYSIMILSGIMAGVIIGQREAKRLGEDPEHIVNIAVVGAFTALVGARLYHVFDRDQWPYYRANPGEIIAVWNGGIGIFGAIAGAAAGLILYVWWVNRAARSGKRNAPKHMGLLRWFDIGAPSFLIGQAVGRWGNFFNQELFGPPTDLPWGIPIDAVYRPAQYASETHFHPLFLYESLLSLLGVVVLLYVARRFASRIVIGDIFLTYFIWYGLERSLLEFMRFDNWKFGPVPMAHIVSAVFIVVATALIVYRHRTRQDREDGEGAVDHGSSRSAMRRRRRRSESPSDG